MASVCERQGGGEVDTWGEEEEAMCQLRQKLELLGPELLPGGLWRTRGLANTLFSDFGF